MKIFILAGQSNMTGKGEMAPATTQGTLQHLAANAPGGTFQFLSNGAGGWKQWDDVWIHYERDDTLVKGNLTTGYGGTATRIGPELRFGKIAAGLYDNQVLIIKTAWGGKSLASDFRPPSSGGTRGFYYGEIPRLVNAATANLGTHFPGYNAVGGYEIAGFCWHQGLVTGSWAAFTPASEIASGADPVESVTITLPSALRSKPSLFVRVVATTD